MASSQKKLAASLKALEALQRGGRAAIRSSDLGRTHRERLLQAGFLQEVIKGWCVPASPSDATSEGMAWFASFWSFCASYLDARFGDDWSLSPEQSLLLQVGEWTVPRQLLLRSPKARNRVTALAHDTSIVETRAALPGDGQAGKLAGLRVFALPAALVAATPSFFRRQPNEARAALAGISDASEILVLLLDGGRSTVAGRIAGGLRNIGRPSLADEISAAMRGAGCDLRERDPFAEPPPFASASHEAPWVARMRLRWHGMREAAAKQFPSSLGLPAESSAYLKALDAAYVEDAYHSLSIEGYQVTPQLIERVRGGAWDPDRHPPDAAQRDALAARGYYESFEAVKKTVADILAGKNPGAAVRDDHGDWHRALFAPSVRAGVLSAAELAGYRTGQVFIRNSRHIPPRPAAVRDLMPVLFDLLSDEQEPAVRALLGHFLFVFIHPYMDGNGRLGRFLMNAMLASGGHPWCVVPTGRRSEYMAALETASVAGNLKPFAQFMEALISGASGFPMEMG